MAGPAPEPLDELRVVRAERDSLLAQVDEVRRERAVLAQRAEEEAVRADGLSAELEAQRAVINDKAEQLAVVSRGGVMPGGLDNPIVAYVEVTVFTFLLIFRTRL